MNLRGITASLAAIAVAVVLPIAIATPAQAGVSPSLITVGLDASGTKCIASTSAIIGNPGSAFTVHNRDCAAAGGSVRVANANFTKPVTGPATIANDSSATLTLTTTSGVLGVVGGVGGVILIPVTITDTPIPEPMAHDEFQQVGVPASGDCADVDPTVGHYPGYPIGGWSQSWAQWINDGTGGPVCTREVEQRPDGTIVLIG